LKRVVAVPGDQVQVWEGRVVIDGQAMPVESQGGVTIEAIGDVRHALGTAFGGGPDFGPTKVPADAYLVLGDNRGNSNDGRYFGWVARDAILGKALSVCLRDDKLVWRGL